MALVNLTNIVVLDNPTSFTNPFTFEITFECIQELEDDLEWKVLYVSSAEDAEQDQVLEEVMVGPVPVGINKFVLQADAPDPSRIPEEDIIGVTVILITCSYREQEFVRVGYYVNNEYTEAFDPENPPRPVDIAKLQRSILHEQPRVTRLAIDWGLGLGLEAPPPQTEEEALAQDGGIVDLNDDNGGMEEDEEDEDEDEEEGEEEEGSGAGVAEAAGEESLGDDDSEEADGEAGDVEGDAMDMGSLAPVRTAAAASSAAAADGMMESPPPAPMMS